MYRMLEHLDGFRTHMIDGSLKIWYLSSVADKYIIIRNGFTNLNEMKTVYIIEAKMGIASPLLQ